MIDQCLKFDQHVRFIKGKISRGIGILYKCKRFFSDKTLLALYNSFVYPYLNYCIPVWGNTYESILDPLVKLQKRAMRIIAGVKSRISSDPLFRKFKVLKVNQIYLYFVHIFVLKYRYNALPPIFDDFFERNEGIHEHNTRNKHLFRMPLIRLDIRKRMIRSTGVLIYNYISQCISLDDEVDCSFSLFKSNLKTLIIDNDLSLQMM